MQMAVMKKGIVVHTAVNSGIAMKRIIKKYKTNRSMFIWTIASVILATVFLAAYFSFNYITDDIGDASSPFEKLFLFPVWAIMGYLSIAALLIGILSAVSGIVCFVLVYPYLGRLREIQMARRENGGKIPKEMLAEMLNSGELDENEYQRELEKYALVEEQSGEEPEPSKWTLLPSLLGGLVLGAAMLGIPALMVYILSKLH